MPKAKTHSGAKKRFKLTKKGKVKRSQAFMGHDIKGCKNSKRKRRLKGTVVADKSNTNAVKRLLRVK